MNTVTAIGGNSRDKGSAKTFTLLVKREQVGQALLARKDLYIVSLDLMQAGKSVYLWYPCRKGGALKTWKRNAFNWVLPVKYGLNTWVQMGFRNDRKIEAFLHLAIESEESDVQ